MKPPKPGTTVFQTSGYEIRKNDEGFTWVVFDIDVLVGISEENFWWFQVRNFRAGRDIEGNIRFFYPQAAYYPRKKRSFRGARPKSNIFINNDLLFALRAEIEAKFGDILKSLPPNRDRNKTIPRKRSETPEEAINVFLKDEQLKKDLEELDIP